MQKTNSRKHIDSSPGNIVDFKNEADQESQDSPASADLAELVWKHFEDEIRETLLEVQELLTDENLESDQQLTQRNQEGK